MLGTYKRTDVSRGGSEGIFRPFATFKLTLVALFRTGYVGSAPMVSYENATTV